MRRVARTGNLVSVFHAAGYARLPAAPTVSPAQLVNRLVTTVTGTANATVGNLAPASVNFTESDIQNKVVKTTDTTDFVGSLVTNLLTKTKLTVAGVPAPGLPAVVSGILAGAATPLDTSLTQVLRTAGVNLGAASAWVNGARCGAAVLAG